MPTEVSHAWLDRVVTARQRLAEARVLLAQLKGLVGKGDLDHRNFVSDEVADVLDRDGTGLRENALSVRLLQLQVELGDAEKHGGTVGPVLQGLTEVIEALQETILNTEALLSDVGEAEDPFIDRLEEHPAYERT